MSAAGSYVLPMFICPRQQMAALPEIEDDDLETVADKYFACDDFGKAKLWYMCTGCEFRCMRTAARGTS